METEGMVTDPPDKDENTAEHFCDPPKKDKIRKERTGKSQQRKRTYSSEENSEDNVDKSESQRGRSEEAKHKNKKLVAETSHNKNDPTSQLINKPGTSKENQNQEVTIIVQPSKEQEVHFFANTIGVFRLLNNSLIGQAGILKNTRNLSRKTYTIVLESNRSLDNILKMNKLGMYTISVTIPRAVAALEYRCGVIGPFGPEVDPEELQEILNDSYEGVTVERIMKGKGENKVKTSQMKVKFKSRELPEYIHILCERFQVRQFIDQPWQCFNCQGFGHSAHHCTRKTKCLLCAGEHRLRDCTQRENGKKCANCGGEHAANSPECLRMKKEKEIQRTRCTNHISYSDAVKVVKTNQGVIGNTSLHSMGKRRETETEANVGVVADTPRTVCKEVSTQTEIDVRINNDVETGNDGENSIGSRNTGFEGHTERQAAFLLDLISAMSQASTIQRKCVVLSQAYESHFNNILNADLIRIFLENKGGKKDKLKKGNKMKSSKSSQ